jgi:hypothetical protein
MRMADSMHAAKNQAAEALKAVLHQLSAIKIKDIDIDLPAPDLKVDILAHLDVYGHSHTLVCRVEASGRPDHVRTALEELRAHTGGVDTNATAVFIAPHLSEEAKAMCGASRTGYLDLEGNAHLDLGEVFIVKRTLPQVLRRPASSAPTHGRHQLAGAA